MTQELDIPVSTLQDALAGRYEIVAPLGHGGMGVVFLAREIRLERLVAIKVLPPARAGLPAVRDRFLREARTAAGLSHPHIIPIFAVDEADPFVYYAMGYVSGGTLGDRVRRFGRLPPAAVARVMRETAWALAYAHARGVIHRDVNPENLLLDRDTGRVLVTDFGIARVGNGGTTGPHQVFGTAEFMSPEQATGRRVDGRSDLYSLGAVGFYALTGRLPFVGHDDQAVLVQHITVPAPALAAEAPWVPRRLAQAVERCLAKDPGARFEHGEALAGALAESGHSDDPPIAVRAFLAEGRHLSTPALLYEIALGCGLAPLLLLAWLTPWRLPLRVTITLLTVAALAAPLVYMVGRVRRLRTAGHDRAELVEAIEAHLARRREELAFVYGAVSPSAERWLRRFVYGAIAAAAASVASWPGAPGFFAGGSPALAAAFCAVAFLAAVAARVRTEQRTDPRGERRLRFWRGPLGRWLFRLAGGRRSARPLDARVPSHPVTPPAPA